MQKRILVITLIATMFAIVQAMGNSKSDKIKYLSPIKCLEEFNDSLLMGQTLCIDICNDRIYISNTGDNQILVLDTNLNYVSAMIPKGRGPRELIYVNRFLIHEGTIYIGNQNQNKFSCFSTNGMYLGDVESSNNNYSTGGRFVINNGYIYISCPDSQTRTSLRRVSLTSDRVSDKQKSFGHLRLFENGYRTHLLNLTDVFGDEDKIYAVEKSSPYIHVFDKENLGLLYSVSLEDNVPAIKDSYRLVKDKMERYKQSGIQIFLDSYFYDGRLYLLMLDWVSQDKSHIFVLDVNDKMNIIHHYITPLITSIAIDGNWLYGLTYEGGVATFRIEL